MLVLNRIREHVSTQDWLAVVLDFAIVVVGVYLGIQAANWNEARAHRVLERTLLAELRAEMAINAERDQSLGNAFMVGAASARRVLAIANSASPACVPDCWSVIVDFMHASQWQRPIVVWTSYEELRRAGLPSDRQVIEAIESYRSLSQRIAISLETPPVYRSLIRQRIPIELQDLYWDACFIETGDRETYRYPCPQPNNVESSDITLVHDILQADGVVPALREWTSLARLVARDVLSTQMVAAKEALESIDRAIAHVN